MLTWQPSTPQTLQSWNEGKEKKDIKHQGKLKKPAYQRGLDYREYSVDEERKERRKETELCF